MIIGGVPCVRYATTSLERSYRLADGVLIQ